MPFHQEQRATDISNEIILKQWKEHAESINQHLKNQADNPCYSPKNPNDNTDNLQSFNKKSSKESSGGNHILALCGNRNTISINNYHALICKTLKYVRRIWMRVISI